MLPTIELPARRRQYLGYHHSESETYYNWSNEYPGALLDHLSMSLLIGTDRARNFHRDTQ